MSHLLCHSKNLYFTTRPIIAGEGPYHLHHWPQIQWPCVGISANVSPSVEVELCYSELKREVREGVQKNYFFSSLLLLLGGRGVGRDVKELLGFFINQVFVGVFQYDSETPKHALELCKIQF